MPEVIDLKVALVALPNPQLLVPEAHFQVGLLYLGGALKRAGHEVVVVDLRGRTEVTEADIPDADCVGVTATSGEYHFARQVGRIAHQRGSKTMIGGAHATFLPEDTCDYYWDYVIKGDGELAAVEALESGKLGIYEHPLESLKGYFPAWELIGERGFSRELFPGAGYGRGPLAAGALTSRGCPHLCAYCRSERDQVRFRPVEDVLAELAHLKRRWGVSHFRFYDECMTLGRLRALDLFNGLSLLNIRWRAHTRSDMWDDELAEAAKRAGLDEMGFGFEAATNTVLEKVRKKETVAQHRKAVRICKKYGIRVKAFWMCGLPNQRWPEMDDIKRFMLEERPERWILSLFAAYPGCDIHAHPDRYAVSFLDPDLSHYWNFGPRSTIGYEDNPREAIEQQYRDLKVWLKVNFGRG